MKRILITGADGSLGSTLCEEAAKRKLAVLPISMAASERAYEGILEGLPICDYIINNHGTNRLSPIGKTGNRDFDRIFRANVEFPYHIINQAVAAGWPPARVLNIASVTYRVPQRMTSLYCASKAALVQMTKVMARELAPSGWVINALAPGKIEDTEMSRRTDYQVWNLRGGSFEAWEKYAMMQIPAGRFTTREEVADAAFRILEMPSYLNGACIDFTGGM